MAAGWNRGKKWSDETKKRISEAMLRNHPMKGKHFTVEQRKRMGEGQRKAIELRRMQTLLLSVLHFDENQQLLSDEMR